jgi:hypothetical protein
MAAGCFEKGVGLAFGTPAFYGSFGRNLLLACCSYRTPTYRWYHDVESIFKRQVLIHAAE